MQDIDRLWIRTKSQVTRFDTATSPVIRFKGASSGDTCLQSVQCCDSTSSWWDHEHWFGGPQDGHQSKKWWSRYIKQMNKTKIDIIGPDGRDRKSHCSSDIFSVVFSAYSPSKWCNFFHVQSQLGSSTLDRLIRSVSVGTNTITRYYHAHDFRRVRGQNKEKDSWKREPGLFVLVKKNLTL